MAEHGERRLAAYTGEDAVVSEPDRQPSIVACAAPWPGMEPLIRRSAALAAQVDGQFRVVAVRHVATRRGAKTQLLAGYAALTEQLGGEFVAADGAGARPGAGRVRQASTR